MTGPMPPDAGASGQPEHEPEPVAEDMRPQSVDTDDTEPLPTVDSFGNLGWGSSWGAGWTATSAGADPGTAGDAPLRNRFDPPEPSRPVMGDLELPAAPEPFEFPAAKSRPASGTLARLAVLGAGVLAILGAAGGLIFWLTNRSPSETQADEATPPPIATSERAAQLTTTTPPPTRDADGQARLLRLLPTGYPPGACTPVDPVPGAAAVVECGNNTDPGGPTSATFTLAADKAALDAAFTAAVRADEVVVCPGNIQSPALCPTGVSTPVGDVRRR